MLILLSPAKSLDYATPLADGVAASATAPQFVPQSSALIALLRQQTPQTLATLMKISDPLAALNVARYQAWNSDPHARSATARPALLAFNGDVYDGLQARSLGRADLDWAQQHLAILSGLYGVLRPLDAMQPYRLEMGTRLATAKGANLYQFWGAQIAEYLNAQLSDDATPVVLNLASQEYFKSVDLKTLRARVVECVFQDYQGGAYKIVSFHAKRARGLMARYCIDQRATRPEQLHDFNAAGYAFERSASAPEKLVFRRRAAGA